MKKIVQFRQASAYSWLVALAFLFAVPNLEAQNATHRVLIGQLDSLANNRAADALYLGLNKSVFELGEELWFSATVMDRRSLLPSGRSEVLYVELRSDETDAPVYQEMYPLQQGLGSGHLLLSDTLKAGTYWLIGFTSHSEKYREVPIRSVRRIELKKTAVPKMLVQLAYEQENYEADEPIAGKIRLLTPGGRPIQDARLNLQLKNGRKTRKRLKLETDADGVAAFSFEGQEDMTTLNLEATASFGGEEETFEAPVPSQESDEYRVEFFPEGGTILAGISNLVAYRVSNGRGMPVEVDSVALVAGDEVLDWSQTDASGIGQFDLYAVAGKGYALRFGAEDARHMLPAVEEEGIQLTLLRQNNRVATFGIQHRGDALGDTVNLAVTQRGSLKRLVSVPLKAQGQAVNVPLDGFMKGIIEARLYDKDVQPLANRLAYVLPDKQLKVEVKTDQKLYGPKDQVKLHLKVTDALGRPVQALLRIKLFDELFSGPYLQSNMLSHFYLSDEAQKGLYQPARYYTEPDANTKRELDALMLTMGDAYAWTPDYLKGLSRQTPMTLRDGVLAQVRPDAYSRSARKQNDFEKEVRYISVYGAEIFNTDKRGAFFVSPAMLQRARGSDMLFRVKDMPGGVIHFQSAHQQHPAHRSVENLLADRRPENATMRNWVKLPQLPNAAREISGVEVTATKSENGSMFGRHRMFEGNNRDYVCINNILNCRHHGSGVPPVDGEWYQLNSGRKVKYKVVLDEPDNTGELDRLQGFYKPPAFYEPPYDSLPEQKQLPDFRNTLLWKPEVLTDENGVLEITFYTSDIRSVFLGKVEAIGINGLLGLGTFKVAVLKE